MNMTDKEYQALCAAMAPRSRKGKNGLCAVLVGGGICLLGQLITEGLTALELPPEEARSWTTVLLIALSALFTALHVYDKLAVHAGAGTLVPVTGFANAVVSPAMEFKAEGFILGVGAKMFTIAGPVIVYGVSASVIYGFIYWISQMLQ